MTPELPGLAVLTWVLLVFLAAGFVHGALGFGFPIVATPLVALATDAKTAIILIAPVTFLVCLLSLLRGGGVTEALRRYAYLPLAMMLGTFLGTRFLIAVRPEPFLLVLAVMIAVWLVLDRFRPQAFSPAQRHPVAFGLAFGVTGGLFEATANVAAPTLLIYFMLLGLPPLSIVQALNLCFLAGKVSQIGTWVAFGDVPGTMWGAACAAALPATAALYAGMRLRERIDAATYRRWLRGALAALAGLLVVQYLRLQG